MAGLADLLTIAGAVGGGVVGGPQGALTGASLGRTAGGMLEPQEQLEQRIQKQNIGPVETAATRRKFQLDQTPLRQIRDSIDSLKYVNDDAMRMELAKPLLQADYLARNKQV